MQTLFLVLILLLLVGIAAVIFLLQRNFRSGKEPSSEQSQRLMLELLDQLRREIQETSGKNRQELQTRLDVISDDVRKNLQFSSQTMQDQFRQSHAVIKEVTSKLTRLDETNQQVLGFSKQMQSLENILRNPKHRGILGEYYLENMLSHVLQPHQYQMQYKFQNGEIVDAVVFYREQIIPIDAKFSLEKYNRIMEAVDPVLKAQLERDFKTDIKQRIDETAKYIRPSEKTTAFAFMFIPAEGVYYNLLSYQVGTLTENAQDLHEYAHKKRVIIVSPTTFFAYLQTVLQGLKVVQTEKNIQLILKKIQDLSRHLENYQIYFQKVGTHIGTVVNTYNQASKEFGKIDRDILKITDGASGGKLEASQLEKPQAESEE